MPPQKVRRSSLQPGKFIPARLIAFAIILVCDLPAVAASGDADVSFDLLANNHVYCTASIGQGGFLTGGFFDTINAQAASRVARITEDGMLDTSFLASASHAVVCAASLADGGYVIGGYFTTLNGFPIVRLALLNASGFPDFSFYPSVNNAVNGITVQADGRMVICGFFTTVNSLTRLRVARLETNGVLDGGFSPSFDNAVLCTALQTDGKLIMGGQFSMVNGLPRSRLVRLHSTGLTDAGFSGVANGDVYCIALQADGKVLIGGAFTTASGVSRNRLARLNTDGTPDLAFNPDFNREVESVVVQADGKIILGGAFTQVGGIIRNRIVRLHPDGAVDMTFNPNANSVVLSLGLSKSGQVLLGGAFTTVGGAARTNLARLQNDPAADSLVASASGTVRWLRGGAAPETSRVIFDLSTNNGATWVPLGTATRITGGWEKTGLSLTPGALVRAHARVTGGNCNGSDGIVEAITTVTPTNDLFADAEVIPSLSTHTVTGTNMGATSEPDEPGRAVSYVKRVGMNSVWWSWTAASSTLVTFDTYGSGFDTVLHVYTGASLGALVLLRASDDARDQKDSRVSFVAQAGVTYRIRVAGRTENQDGLVLLNVNTAPSPVTADGHVAYGRSYLEGRTMSDLDAADTHFAQALALSPTHMAANALRAVTRIARLQADPAFVNLLAQWGLTTTRAGLHKPRYDAARDGLGAYTAPPTANTSQSQMFGSIQVMSALTASDSNLAQVTSTGFRLLMSDSETCRRWINLDYGDVQVLRALGKAFQAVIHMNNSVITDASLGQMLELENQGKLDAGRVLSALPNLLRKRAADERPAFKNAIQSANSLYQAGSLFIRSRADTADNPHHLFRIGSHRDRREEELRENGNGIASGLDGAAPWAGRTVNFSSLIATATDYRDLLPRVKGNRGVVSTAPDPVFLGGLVGGTQSQVNQILADNNALYDIATFAAWVAILFDGFPLADQSPGGDPDGDGLSNLQEYVFVLDPLSPSSTSEFMSQSVIPGASPDQKHFAISFIRHKSPTAISYRVDVSDDLAGWDQSGLQLQQVGVPAAQPDGLTELVTFQISQPVAALQKKFMKVVATLP